MGIERSGYRSGLVEMFLRGPLSVCWLPDVVIDDGYQVEAGC